MEKKIVEKFLAENFGMVYLAGFKYLVSACEMYPAQITNIYKKVAEKYNTTSTKVERNIRYYKEKINCYGIFKCAVSDKFSNEEFLAIIDYTIREGRYEKG